MHLKAITGACALLALCAAALAAFAQDPAETPPEDEEVERKEVPREYADMKAPDLKDAERIASGKKLYTDPAKANCSMCHGDGGKGDGLQAPNYKEPPVGDLTTAKFQDAVTDQYIYWRIKDANGSKFYATSGMLGYPNGTEEDIWSIVAYVRSLKEPEVKILTKDEFKDLMEDIKASWNALQKAAKAKDAKNAIKEGSDLEAHARKILGNDSKTADGKLVREQDDFRKFAEAFGKAAKEYAGLATSGEWDKAAEKQTEIGDGCANCHDVYKKKR